MKRILLILAATMALIGAGMADSARAREPVRCRSAWGTPWHGQYYNVQWGMPVALVVPPTAEYQTHYSWGVGGFCVSPICLQFNRNWPGGSQYDPRDFRPTPPWPSSTDQFGIYYMRGPW